MIARKLWGRVTKDRQLEVVVPEDMEPGTVEIILLRKDPRQQLVDHRFPEPSAKHPAFGIWADRTDIQDPWAFATALRQRIEMRRDGEPLP